VTSVKERQYIPPSIAYRQLKTAFELGNAVYIYDATGYGKSRLVKEFLDREETFWFSALDDEWDFSRIETNKISKGSKRTDANNTYINKTNANNTYINKTNANNTYVNKTNASNTNEYFVKENESRKICIVFDDVQFINSNEQKDNIINYVRNGQFFVVIIGRSKSPQWIISLMAEGLVRIISEKHLQVTKEDVIKIAAQNDVKLNNEDALALVENGEGNVFAISTAIQYLKQNMVKEEDLVETIRNIFVNHLEQEVIPQWDVYIQEFLMMISVVDEFNLSMAVMITGDDQAAGLIEEIITLGNFINMEGEYYHLRPQLLLALRQRALKVFGLNEYNRFIANAAHYYEMQDNILMALDLYEQCGKKENIRALLIRNSRRHTGAGYYYELRKYYFALDEEDIEKTPILMSAMSLLYSILMNPEKSEYWYGKLTDYSKKVKAAEKRETDELLLFLDLSLPHRGPKSMQNVMKHAFKLLQGGKFKIPELSVTNNGPSAMNGGMDFCEWSKKDKLIADTIGKIVETVSGTMGRGLVHAALSESIFEKGVNDAEATHNAMLLNLDVEGGGKYEMLFISVAIQARIAIISGNPNNAMRVIDAYEEHLENYNNDALRRNLNAFRCRVNLTIGNTAFVEEWLKEAPDEVVDFCVLERYRYMTKALCYIQFGMNYEAIDILTKLRYYAEEYQRAYIHMETGLLISIISRRNGGEWKDIFLSTLFEIQDYQFVRIISEKGAGILPLLKDIKKDYLAEKKADSGWFMKTLKETEMMAKKYPGLLNCTSPQPNDFTEIDVEILTLQAEGLSTKEIANRIYMSERTVKYHASENYKKLGASGKVEAIQIAKSIHLI